MKTIKFVVAACLVGALWMTAMPSKALADVRQPASAQRAAYESDLYYAPPDAASDSPSDQAAPPPANGEAKNGEAKTNGGEEAKEEEEKPEEPWRLIGELGGTRLNVYGWLDMGITGNTDGPASRFNGPLAPNDRNEFQFNQTYLVMERTLKTDEHPWDFGGRIDLLYGTDWIYGVSTGFETHPDGSPNWNDQNFYGLIMPQVYGEIGYRNFSLKLGRMYTMIGYESLMAPNNFFYSMNYALRYAEPTTHTGGYLTWKANEEWTLHVCGVNGQDRTDGLVDALAVMTGFAYTPKEKKYSLNFSIMTGGLEPTLDPTVFAPRTYFSTYLTYNFTKKFQSVTQWDAGWQQNFDLQGNTADFWSLTQYLFYTINPCWKAGLRYDMFVDDQGTRLGGLRFGGLPGGNPLPLPSGNAGTVQALTAGLNYTYNTNLRLRPELRWDWFGGQGLPLFDDRTQNRQFTAAIDLIMLF